MADPCGFCGKTDGHVEGCVWGAANEIVEQHVRAKQASDIAKTLMTFCFAAARDRGWKSISLKEIWRTDLDGHLHITLDFTEGTDA